MKVPTIVKHRYAENYLLGPHLNTKSKEDIDVPTSGLVSGSWGERDQPLRGYGAAVDEGVERSACMNHMVLCWWRGRGALGGFSGTWQPTTPKDKVPCVKGQRVTSLDTWIKSFYIKEKTNSNRNTILIWFRHVNLFQAHVGRPTGSDFEPSCLPRMGTAVRVWRRQPTRSTGRQRLMVHIGGRRNLMLCAK